MPPFPIQFMMSHVGFAEVFLCGSCPPLLVSPDLVDWLASEGVELKVITDHNILLSAAHQAQVQAVHKDPVPFNTEFGGDQVAI